MKRKLKLTKLTIADLDRVKGGIHECGCLYTDPTNAVNNYNLARTISLCAPFCWVNEI
ncbi:MAG TPA: hypothetical protein VK186_09545 [Candidatus Deferrimicrobium sp.]|nr:hypothetical protein [Candidatus Kapabacteria bacterium]HLP59063.1 hypothetical protein [Candidatus Deferrimicrobium sp.]